MSGPNPWDRVDTLERKVAEMEARLRRLEERQQPTEAIGRMIPGGTLHVPNKGRQQ